jgi:hypothetical protein
VSRSSLERSKVEPPHREDEQQRTCRDCQEAQVDDASFRYRAEGDGAGEH